MLFDIGWPELMLIGVIALVVIGPKDLPRALRVAGYWVRKARTLSREFQSSIDQMIREAELDEVRQDLKKAVDFNIEHEFNKTVDPDGSLAASLRPEIPDHFEPPPPPGESVLVEPDTGPALPALTEVSIAPAAELSPGEPVPALEGFEPAEPAAEPAARVAEAAPPKP